MKKEIQGPEQADLQPPNESADPLLQPPEVNRNRWYLRFMELFTYGIVTGGSGVSITWRMLENQQSQALISALIGAAAVGLTTARMTTFLGDIQKFSENRHNRNS